MPLLFVNEVIQFFSLLAQTLNGFFDHGWGHPTQFPNVTDAQILTELFDLPFELQTVDLLCQFHVLHSVALWG
jgi:hypothetical protein